MFYIDKNTQIFYSVDMTGNDIRQIADKKVVNYNIYDKGIIICVDKSLYKTDFELTQLEWLCDSKPFDLNEIGNSLIYPKKFGEEFYIMDIDKKESKVINLDCFETLANK